MADPEEILRVGRLLESLIAFKKVPVRQLERELGLSPAYLSRVFRGAIELKLRHILDILEAIDIAPEVFFKLAFGDPQDQANLGAALAAVGLRRRAPEPPRLTKSDVQQVVLETLAQLGVVAEPTQPPAPSDDAPQG
jgi:transcriptional regulator with XRE-family HTH domain